MKSYYLIINEAQNKQEKEALQLILNAILCLDKHKNIREGSKI